MLSPVFSTVACPEWTLPQVFAAAARMGWLGVELRTFGDGSRGFASEPALTAPEKIRLLADETGVRVAALGTSHRFDQPITPPVIGLVIGDPDRCVREAKTAIDLAVTIECPLVRVFAFEPPSSEARESALVRITDRLSKVVDAAHRTGVRIVLENGGGFTRARDLVPLLERVNSPLLGAAYNLAVGLAAGDTPDEAARLLGPRLLMARIKDLRDGRPCKLGTGQLPCREFLASLVRSGFEGPLCYDWDRAWLTGLAPAEEALSAASVTLFGWLSELGAATPSRAPARV
jgi:sugar phosphate isomerase/epimerase